MSTDMAVEHVNVNGSEESTEPMDTTASEVTEVAEGARSEHFQTLLDAGLPQKAACRRQYMGRHGAGHKGLVAHSDLDERAIEALKEFNEDGALQNKSAFLCGVMKTYRQREKQGTRVAEATKGPDEAKLKTLLQRTGYTLDVTTGQRKYGGPPPESVHQGGQPAIGTEVLLSDREEIFVGKIPRDLFEDELVPLFEKAGPIWDLRLMMDPLSGMNRGYAFLTFCTKEAAQGAVQLCNNHEIRPGKHIGVCISVANNRLFVGSIPKSKTKEQIVEEFSKVTGRGLSDVILYHQPDDKKKNRGFCFLEYEDHKTAAQARRRLMSGKVKVWGNVVTVEWADPIEDPDPEVMAKPPDLSLYITYLLRRGRRGTQRVVSVVMRWCGRYGDVMMWLVGLFRDRVQTEPGAGTPWEPLAVRCTQQSTGQPGEQNIWLGHFLCPQEGSCRLDSQARDEVPPAGTPSHIREGGLSNLRKSLHGAGEKRTSQLLISRGSMEPGDRGAPGPGTWDLGPGIWVLGGGAGGYGGVISTTVGDVVEGVRGPTSTSTSTSTPPTPPPPPPPPGTQSYARGRGLVGRWGDARGRSYDKSMAAGVGRGSLHLPGRA
ncbi:hypothetical protein CRUP_028918 [Coryphaenoides rupestris]|nr:hypothetical protein CRUP_028918 [Coryphaenoides rupestris]